MNNKLLLIGLLVAFFLVYKKEGFSNFHHRSQLTSTFWLNKPQIQHTFPSLGLQYPNHEEYFKESCYESTPNNAELCRYHKHRFDPAQL